MAPILSDVLMMYVPLSYNGILQPPKRFHRHRFRWCAFSNQHKEPFGSPRYVPRKNVVDYATAACEKIHPL